MSFSTRNRVRRDGSGFNSHIRRALPIHHSLRTVWTASSPDFRNFKLLFRKLSFGYNDSPSNNRVLMLLTEITDGTLTRNDFHFALYSVTVVLLH